MKAYGHSRTDGKSCEYGCCTGKTDKRKVGRAQVDRARRNAARQAHAKECDILQNDGTIAVDVA